MAKKYKQTFLKQVLVRVDFQKPLENYEKNLSRKVETTIEKTFPSQIEQRVKQQSVTISPTNQPVVSNIDQILWTYYAKNKKKHTRIEPTDFYIQYDKYSSFGQFKKDFKLVFYSLVENYKELNITRIGLRYIDEIEIKGESDVFDWKRYLNPKLFSIFTLPVKKDRDFISRAFSNLEFNYGDHNLILKYGMFNPDYPSPIKKKVFILDSDAYKRDNIPNEEALSVLGQLHDRISNLFEKRLIKEGLREIMNDRR